MISGLHAQSHRAINALETMRGRAGSASTKGLDDAIITRFAALDSRLVLAIDAGLKAQTAVLAEHPELITGPEHEAVQIVQAGYVNFYPDDAVNPYLGAAALGPWIVTLHGAVVHDSGGYGMLGFGHAPAEVLNVMAQPWIMANIMSPSVSQLRFVQAIRREVGHTRAGCPFHRFICMNSGSEANTVAARITDANALHMTQPGGKYEGRTPVFIGMERAFHGRTGRPAQVSSSSLPSYQRHLRSFQGRENLWQLPSNDIAALQAAFQRADDEGYFVEAMFLEPVQGEGSPGRAVTRAFYDEARRLTTQQDSLLIVDSIQAGFRAQGVLSMVDYPGFEDCEAPDIEAWSKAINAGQYPFSVLGLTERSAAMYAKGIYGNTMTTNPRALEVAVNVLNAITPELRQNVRRQGELFVEGLQALQQQFPRVIVDVVGSGLLFCAELDPAHFTVQGHGSAEELCRYKGLGVIHGGRNALRFTPNFNVTDEERAMVLDVLASALIELDARLDA